MSRVKLSSPDPKESSKPTVRDPYLVEEAWYLKAETQALSVYQPTPQQTEFADPRWAECIEGSGVSCAVDDRLRLIGSHYQCRTCHSIYTVDDVQFMKERKNA